MEVSNALNYKNTIWNASCFRIHKWWCGQEWDIVFPDKTAGTDSAIKKYRIAFKGVCLPAMALRVTGWACYLLEMYSRYAGSAYRQHQITSAIKLRQRQFVVMIGKSCDLIREMDLIHNDMAAPRSYKKQQRSNKRQQYSSDPFHPRKDRNKDSLKR